MLHPAFVLSILREVLALSTTAVSTGSCLLQLLPRIDKWAEVKTADPSCDRSSMQLKRQQNEVDAADSADVEALQQEVQLRQQEVDKAALRLCNEAIKAHKCVVAK